MQQVVSALQLEWAKLQLDSRPQGASWCAFELALLDAAGKCAGKSVSELIGGGPPDTGAIRYGAVIPFGGKKALLAMLWFYKLYGFQTVKIKVGRDLDLDLYRLRLARAVLGPNVTLRVDANCAWSLDETLHAAEQMRPFGVQSYEQPVPAVSYTHLSIYSRRLTS